MGSGQDFQDLIDRLAAAATDAREAVREAHAARKDLAREVKEAEAFITGLVAKKYEELIEPALRTELTTLRDKITETQEKKAAQIMRAFDRLANTIMYGTTKKGAPSSLLIPPGSQFHTAARKAADEATAPPADGK